MRHDDTCSSCRAPIRWAVHETTGRRMPLDPTPVADGNVVVVEWRNVEQTRGAYALPVIGVGAKALGRAATGYRYTSHFATCPNAKQHRRDRGAVDLVSALITACMVLTLGAVAYILARDAADERGPTTPTECIDAGGDAWFDRYGNYDRCILNGRSR